MEVRPPAVAGMFYQGNARRLHNSVAAMLDEAPEAKTAVSARMLIVPHAGHVYSGPVAAVAYRLLGGLRPRRVGLIGPSHYVGFEGLAVPGHEAFETPLGTIPIDSLTVELENRGLAQRSIPAHQREHSLADLGKTGDFTSNRVSLSLQKDDIRLAQKLEASPKSLKLYSVFRNCSQISHWSDKNMSRN